MQCALYTRLNCNTETNSPIHQCTANAIPLSEKMCRTGHLQKYFLFQKISLCTTLASQNKKHHHLHCIGIQHVWLDNSSFMWISHTANVFLTCWWFEESLFIHMECTREYWTLGSTPTDADKTQMREFSSSLTSLTNITAHHLKPCTSNTSN